ncbi:hypothetical protein EF908_00940, partial [Streptomyces sp. WAC04770]
ITPAPVPAELPAASVVSLVKSTDRVPVGAVAADAPRPRRVTGRVPGAARSVRPNRTADELLTEARKAATGWSDRELTAEGIRRAVHTSPAKARVLRDTLRAERAKKAPAPTEAAPGTDKAAA